MKTKSLKFLSVFVAVIIAFSCFSVSAVTGVVYTVPCSRPAVGDFQGYAEICFSSGSDTNVVVVAWNISRPTPNVEYESSVMVDLYQNKVVFRPFIRPLDNNAFMDWFAVYSNSYFSSGTVPFGVDYGDNTVDFANDYTVHSVKVYGNARLNKVYNPSYTNFSVLYSEAGTIYNELLTTSSLLRDILSSNELIQSDVSSILKHNSSIDSKLSQLYTMIYNSFGVFSDEIRQNAYENALSIQSNADKNTDKILNSGSNVNQPDFAGTNNQLDSTTSQMNAIEGQYIIDQASTTAELNKGTVFLSGSDINKASIQVKTWIERFGSDNPVISSFLVAALCLGLCFWVIGRKAVSR